MTELKIILELLRNESERNKRILFVSVVPHLSYVTELQEPYFHWNCNRD